MQFTILNTIQIITGVLLILFIILQSKGVGLSGTFGGEGMFYRSKRGVEKLLYRATIVDAIVLGISSLILVVLSARL